MKTEKRHAAFFTQKAGAVMLVALLALGLLLGCSALRGETVQILPSRLQPGVSEQAYGLETDDVEQQGGEDLPAEPSDRDIADPAAAIQEESSDTQGEFINTWQDVYSGSDSSSGGMSLLSTTSDSDPVVSMEWAGHTYAAYDIQTSWADAQSYCESVGGHLGTITSQAEQNFVQGSLLSGLSRPYWIGLSYATGAWQWVTGEPYGGYRNFALDETYTLTNDRGIIFACDGIIYHYRNGIVVEQSFVPAGQWGFVTDDGYDNLTGFICEWDNLASIPRMDMGESESPDSGSLWADPVDLATGAMKIDLSYLDQSANVDFALDLTYDGGRLVEGEMGAGWHHNYEKTIVARGDKLYYYSNPSTYIEFSSGDGSNVYRTSTPGKQNWTLTRQPDGSFYLACGFSQYLSFSSDGKLARIANRVGDYLEVSHSGNTTTVHDPFSKKSLVLSRSDAGLLEHVESKNDGVTSGDVSIGHFSDQLVITDPNGATTYYRHDGKGRITQILNDEEEQVALNTYDEQGRIVEQDDGLDDGNVTRFAYGTSDADNVLYTIVTDRVGEESCATFDPKAHRLLSIVDREGYKKSYAYDEQGNLISETDANGNATTYAYNANNDVLSKTDATGAITTYAYDERSNMTAVTDPDGATTTNSFGEWDRLVSTTSPNGTTTTFEYADPFGGHELASKTISKDGVSRQYSYTYTMRLKTSETDPEGNTTTYSYDALGRLASTIDMLGNTTSTVYDAMGNILSETNAEGGTQTYTYDWNGNLLSETDEEGGITAYSYNANGKLMSKIDALGNETTYSYDTEDRLVGVIDPSGNATQMTNDREGRLTRSSDGLGNVTSYTYDSVGNLLTEKTPQSNTTTYAYDGNGRLTATTDMLRKTYTQVRNATGNVTSIRRSGDVTEPFVEYGSYAYDVLGRTVVSLNAAGQRHTYAYDATGNLTQHAGPLGTRAYDYDATGRLTGFDDAEGATAFSYDRDGNLTSASDAQGTLQRSYDGAGHVVSSRDAQGNATSYYYDSVGNLVTLVYPDGRPVFYTYDAVDNMSSVTDWADRTTRYTYDAVGNLTRVARPDGSFQTYTYDKANRITETYDRASDGTVIEQCLYTYNNKGKLQAESSKANATMTSYAYDVLGRMTSMSTKPTSGSSATVATYAYDAYGNITSSPKASSSEGPVLSAIGPSPGIGTTVKATYDMRNRLTTFGGQGTSHDAEGNMTRGPLRQGAVSSLAYDSGNRLVGVGGTTYAYDALDNRTSRTDASGRATAYAYDASSGSSNLLASTAPDRGVTSYVYGMGLVASEGPGGTYLTHHYDGRGSTVALTDASGAVVGRYAYSPYGQVSSHTGNASTAFLYLGLYGVIDDGDGLLFMRARYYSPYLMRFVNADQLAGSASSPATLNRYAYALGDPLLYLDPLGRSAALASGAHAVLDVAGFVPVAGAAFDVANGVWYAFEGDWSMAGFSLLAAVPGAGDAAGAAKVGVKAAGIVGDAAKLGSKAEKAAKGAGKYAAPAGGGGVSASKMVNGKTVTFGHGGCHLEGTKIDVDRVNSGIAEDISKREIPAGSSFAGHVTTNGTTVEYRAYGREDGTIHVGTYYIV